MIQAGLKWKGFCTITGTRDRGDEPLPQRSGQKPEVQADDESDETRDCPPKPVQAGMAFNLDFICITLQRGSHLWFQASLQFPGRTYHEIHFNHSLCRCLFVVKISVNTAYLHITTHTR